MSTGDGDAGGGGWPPRRPRLPPRRRPERTGDACSSAGGEAQPVRRVKGRGVGQVQGRAGSPRSRRIASRRSGNGRGESSARRRPRARNGSGARARGRCCRGESERTARPRNAPPRARAGGARGRLCLPGAASIRAHRAAGGSDGRSFASRAKVSRNSRWSAGSVREARSIASRSRAESRSGRRPSSVR